MAEKTPIFAFEDVRVEPRAFKAWKNGNEIPLEPKTFHVLLFLIEHRGRLVEKNELLDAVWKDTFVTENAMTREIAKLRKALGDDSKEPRYIQTVHTRGYRFIADVREVCDEAEEVSAPERTTTHLPGEQGKADTLRRALKNERALADSLTVVEKETPHAVKDPISTSVIKRRTMWLPLALVVGLLAIGAAVVFWLSKNRGRANDTPTISRTVQITSWSGLDFYPSISPDGNTVAFSSDRTGSFEIYVKQLVAGAREVQLTSDAGQNFEPAFSPDGSLIAYHSKKRGGIWVVPLTGGTAKQLTEFGSHPAWSPAGSQIAFQSDPLNDFGSGVRNAMPPSTIWLVSAKGGEPKQLTQAGNPLGGHGAPAWSPDGKRVVFDTNDWNNSSVWSLTSQGEDLKQISPKPRMQSDAVYAPDGKSIFVIGETGRSLEKINVSEAGEPIGEPVKLFDASGSRIRQIAISAKGNRIVYTTLLTISNIWATPLSPNTNEANGIPIQLTQITYTRTALPSFSPDGKKIAYVSYTTGLDTYIWTMDADGKNQTQITTGLVPWWFPDGKRIAFSSQRENRFGLWSITAEGGKEKKLFDFDGDASVPRISPDGKRVAFNSKKSGTINIWIIPIEGGEAKQLTFDKELAGFPAWSPDGKWISFQIKRGDDTHVCIIPIEGGEPIQLTFDKGQSWTCDWSPDGDKIIFAGQRDGIWNVYWVSRSTKGQKQLTNFRKLNSYVRYTAWSPTGDKIAYEYAETNGNIWMIELE